MNFEWQQRRFLRDLDDIYEHGGDLVGRRERSDRGEILFHLTGWKGHQTAERTEIACKLGEDLITPLQESGYITLDATSADEYRFAITQQGANALRGGD
jgi:hypothetical protein